MLRIYAILGALTLASPAMAQTCPPQQLDRAALDALHDELRGAADIGIAQTTMDGLWRIWSEAPDATAREMLESGKERIRLADCERAVAMFDQLIDYCPDFAEAYNQRAFAHFLKEDYAPALAGRGLTLLGMGREREALDALERAVALNPFLMERQLIPALKRKLGLKDL